MNYMPILVGDIEACRRCRASRNQANEVTYSSHKRCHYGNTKVRVTFQQFSSSKVLQEEGIFVKV